MCIISVIADPELGSTAFTVERIRHTRGRKGTTCSSRTARAVGCVHPGTPEDAGASFTAPDRIHWKGRTWRVVRVRDWSALGYVQAYAVLMHE